MPVIHPDEGYLNVSTDGGNLILKTKLATITLDASRWKEVVLAIYEVCQSRHSSSTSKRTASSTN